MDSSGFWIELVELVGKLVSHVKTLSSNYCVLEQMIDVVGFYRVDGLDWLAGKLIGRKLVQDQVKDPSHQLLLLKQLLD